MERIACLLRRKPRRHLTWFRSVAPSVTTRAPSASPDCTTMMSPATRTARTCLGRKVSAVSRSQTTLRDRWQRLRLNAMLTLQTGCAAGLAWFLAHDLLRHPVPFFAPIAAVITLGVSTSQRLRRSVELVLGVAVGIAVGEVIIVAAGLIVGGTLGRLFDLRAEYRRRARIAARQAAERAAQRDSGGEPTAEERPS